MKIGINKTLGREFKIPKAEKISSAVRSFSLTEKIIFYFFVALFAGSGLTLLWKVNKEYSVEVPASGGSLTEGVLGSPRFINPILAVSDADRDLVYLVYSGLMKATPDGKITGDLAESYSVSPDGLEYDFKIKADAKFQDGWPVTADDVEFTVKKAQDNAVKSSKKAAWDGVTVEKTSDKEVKFLLKQAYSPFLENATLGILPKHLWNNLDSDAFSQSYYNIEPVGSGPYKISSIKKNANGLASQYTLESSASFLPHKPFIDQIIFKFYPNEDALLEAYNGGQVESVNSISPQKADELKKSGASVVKTALPRIFGVFFNQNEGQVFLNKEVRQALNIVTDKNEIVNAVLDGYGSPIDDPIPPGLLGDSPAQSETATASTTADANLAQAKKLLSTNGWKANTQTGILEKKTKNKTYQLKFSISTSDAPELARTAEILKNQWEKLGAKVDIKTYETGEINQSVIRPRKYEALLFGEIIGRDLDLYAFWHSSQRNDPGLNIALYTNIKTDKLLEESRLTSDPKARADKYKKIEAEIKKDAPAVFTYSPDFIYVVPDKIKNLALGEVTTPSERFLGVADWYTETDSVWKIFAPESAETETAVK